MTTSVTILLFFAVVYKNLYTFVKRFTNALTISVYLEPKTPEARLKELKERLEKTRGVKGVRIKKGEALLEELKEAFGKDIEELVSAEELPVVLEVALKDPLRDFNRVKRRLAELKEKREVLEVRYAETWLSRVVEFEKLTKTLLLLSGALVLSSLAFLTTVTMALTIERQREEVEVLALLGATYGYIARPKVFLNFLTGFASAGTALFMTYALKGYLEGSLSGILPFAVAKLQFFSLKESLLVTLLTGVFCACVSLLSVKRYFY